MKVIQLKATDNLDFAIKLLQRFFHEEGFATPGDVITSNTLKLASLDTCGLFVVEADGLQIAVATVSLEFGIEYGWGAELGDLYIVPEWRGMGVSALIVAHVETFLKARGVSGYQVTVTPFGEQHVGLNKFYDRLGFANEGRILRYKSLV